MRSLLGRDQAAGLGVSGAAIVAGSTGMRDTAGLAEGRTRIIAATVHGGRISRAAPGVKTGPEGEARDLGDMIDRCSLSPRV
jgi:hypothetical protein